MSGSQFFVQAMRAVIGFLLAIIAVGIFLSWGLFQEDQPGHVIAFAVLAWVALATTGVIGAAVFFPALIAIVVTELLGWRSALVQVGLGGAIAFVLWTLDGAYGGDLRSGSDVAVTAGFLGGLIYWTIAGRYAGRWRKG